MTEPYLIQFSQKQNHIQKLNIYERLKSWSSGQKGSTVLSAPEKPPSSHNTVGNSHGGSSITTLHIAPTAGDSTWLLGHRILQPGVNPQNSKVTECS